MSKVLIIKLGALGDMLRAAPAIRCLCQRYGAENISILTIDSLQELVRKLFGKAVAVLASLRHKGMAALKNSAVVETIWF